MRVFKIDSNSQMTAAELMALILVTSREAHIHPLVSDLIEVDDLENKLRAMPVYVALATCSKILRAVSAMYTVSKILEGDHSNA